MIAGILSIFAVLSAAVIMLTYLGSNEPVGVIERNKHPITPKDKQYQAVQQSVEIEIEQIKHSELAPREKGKRLLLLIKPGMNASEVLRLLEPASPAMACSHGCLCVYCEYELGFSIGPDDRICAVGMTGGVLGAN